jgi:hypothetical protein
MENISSTYKQNYLFRLLTKYIDTYISSLFLSWHSCKAKYTSAATFSNALCIGCTYVVLHLVEVTYRNSAANLRDVEVDVMATRCLGV